MDKIKRLFFVDGKLGGGFGGVTLDDYGYPLDGEILEFNDENEAYSYAHELASDEYESYSGLHGLPEDDDPEYEDEKETWLDPYVKEITSKPIILNNLNIGDRFIIKDDSDSYTDYTILSKDDGVVRVEETDEIFPLTMTVIPLNNDKEVD